MRIIEGRQLAGANISPVVRVTIDNQTRQTKVIKSTNKPFYDEVCKTENNILSRVVLLIIIYNKFVNSGVVQILGTSIHCN